MQTHFCSEPIKLIEAKRLDARKLGFKTLITVASVVALQHTTPKMTHGTYDRFFKKPKPTPTPTARAPHAARWPEAGT